MGHWSVVAGVENLVKKKEKGASGRYEAYSRSLQFMYALDFGLSIGLKDPVFFRMLCIRRRDFDLNLILSKMARFSRRFLPRRFGFGLRFFLR